ncbi:hypothetical protein P7K49_002141 [Saguinus oedipus]|uniref:Uncharacterized protein n=1 Tax=Saguinus oedipus TaxID=9490 RepID=A0ABQ9WGH5_SAGOE|nr:hypothetical protein P7K49_002141 [Saguinus oedipus]
MARAPLKGSGMLCPPAGSETQLAAHRLPWERRGAESCGQTLLLPTHSSSLPAWVSPEQGRDVLSHTQAKTSFLESTGARHQVPRTRDPLGAPESCPTPDPLGTPSECKDCSYRAGRNPICRSPHRRPGLQGGAWRFPDPPRRPVTHEGREAVRREVGAPKLRGVGHAGGERLSGGAARGAPRTPTSPRTRTHYRLKPPRSPSPLPSPSQ